MSENLFNLQNKTDFLLRNLYMHHSTNSQEMNGHQFLQFPKYYQNRKKLDLFVANVISHVLTYVCELILKYLIISVH